MRNLAVLAQGPTLVLEFDNTMQNLLFKEMLQEVVFLNLLFKEMLQEVVVLLKQC